MPTEVSVFVVSAANSAMPPTADAPPVAADWLVMPIPQPPAPPKTWYAEMNPATVLQAAELFGASSSVCASLVKLPPPPIIALANAEASADMQFAPGACCAPFCRLPLPGDASASSV